MAHHAANPNTDGDARLGGGHQWGALPGLDPGVGGVLDAEHLVCENRESFSDIELVLTI